jgi:ribosomal protein L32
MPRYNVQNDGVGPYAVFYCDMCGREYRSQPDVVNTISKDIGRQTMGSLLRNIPMVGSTLANNVAGEDPRYTYNLTPQQLEKAWAQVKDRFRECPTCHQIVCVSDFDEPSGFCREDSPRRNEIAEAQAEQAGHMIKGIASVFGLDKAVEQASQAAKKATSQMARCPQDGTLAAPGTRFCPECGSAMIQPVEEVCPNCGQPTGGAKFCPNCGTKQQQAPLAVCPNCGAETQGAKFCSECGTKLI